MTKLESPLVSVIMIFFNAESYIEEAIESVLRQTYCSWELILVDDGSTDRSSRIAASYAREPRIRYVEHAEHANRGMSTSRNAGVSAAKGSMIAFLDADDVYLPDKLERQVAVLTAQPRAAMVYGATIYWRSWDPQANAAGQHDTVRKLGVRPDTLIEPPTLARVFMSGKGHTPATCSVLIRRTIFEAIGGFEDQFRGMFEDQAFFFKLCLEYPVFVVSGSCDFYRQHPRSECHVAIARGAWRRDGRSDARHAFLSWLHEYMSTHEIADPELWKLLRAELRTYEPVRRGIFAMAARTMRRFFS